MSTLLKVATGVVVGTIAVGGTVAIVNYYKLAKFINNIHVDTENIMKDIFGDQLNADTEAAMKDLFGDETDGENNYDPA